MENETTLTNPDDRYDQLCTECGMGRYHETSIHDDWDGVLHCTNKECNHEVKRYKSDDNPPPKPEKAKLSPAAQAVLDAVINVAESPDAEAIAAAVLRALLAERGEVLFDENGKMTDFVVMQGDILTIAKELEAQ
jgi:hypothetical protein